MQLKVHISAVPLPGPGWGGLTQALGAPGGNVGAGVQSTAQHQERLCQLLPKVAPTDHPNLQAVAVPQGSQQVLLSPAPPGGAEKLALAEHGPHRLSCPSRKGPTPHVRIAHPSPTPCIQPNSHPCSPTGSPVRQRLMAAAWHAQHPWGLGLEPEEPPSQNTPPRSH